MRPPGAGAPLPDASRCRSVYGVFGMNFLLDNSGQPADAPLVPDPAWLGGKAPASFRMVTCIIAILSVAAWVALVYGFRRRGFIHIVGHAPLPKSAHAQQVKSWEG